MTQKIVKAAIAISYGEQEKLTLGNLDAMRDWGHAKDYVKGMYLMLQQDKPVDYVLATGEIHSVRECCEYVFKKLGLDPDRHVEQDPKFMRPEELKYLCGDSFETRKSLNWEPEYTFETMLDEMIENWQNNVATQK